MTETFITLRFLDVLDILLVAFLIYELYLLIRGTAAFNIFLGIFIFYITWIIIKALDMELMGSILGQVMGVGVLALIVVFQQEIRKMFLLLGTRYNLNNKFSFENLFSREKNGHEDYHVKEIVMACEAMSRSKTGALIVLVNKTELQEYVDTGVLINSCISGPLLQTIFFKNSPLHDGAVIVNNGKIVAARCVLPLSSKRLKNDQLGLRHRAALGISQATDAQVIVVSEETGKLSYAFNGTLHENLNPVNLIRIIEKVYEKQK